MENKFPGPPAGTQTSSPSSDESQKFIASGNPLSPNSLHLPTNDNIGDIVALFKFYISPDPELQNVQFIAGEHACLLRKTSLISQNNENNDQNESKVEQKQSDSNDLLTVDVNIVSDIEQSRIDLSRMFLQCLQNTSKYHRSIVETTTDFLQKFSKNRKNRANANNNTINNNTDSNANRYLRHRDIGDSSAEFENDNNNNQSFCERCQLYCELNISESQSCLIILIILLIVLTIILAIIGVETMVYFWVLFVFISLMVLLILFVYWRYNHKYNSYYNETLNKLEILCSNLNNFENNNYQYCDCYFELIPQSSLNKEKKHKTKIMLKQAVIRVTPRESQQMGKDPEIADD